MMPEKNVKFIPKKLLRSIECIHVWDEYDFIKAINGDETEI